jgi:hypothetical protein
MRRPSGKGRCASSLVDGIVPIVLSGDCAVAIDVPRRTKALLGLLERRKESLVMRMAAAAGASGMHAALQ